MQNPLTKLLTMPTTQLGRATRFLILQVRLWVHCARLLRKNRAGQKAAALSYHTIFGLLPMAIVMLMVFQALPAYRGVGQKVQHFVYEQLQLTSIVLPADPNSNDSGQVVDDSSQMTDHSDQMSDEGSAEVQMDGGAESSLTEGPRMLTDYLDDLVVKFFSGVDKGSITLLGAVLVIWAALALLVNAERVFNEIWHVARGRSLINRIINYWALLTLGPLLLGVGLHLAGSHTALGQLQKTLSSSWLPLLISYGIAMLGFFLVYFVLPNTKVDPRAALWGALVAALVWSLAKWGFRQYVTLVIPYSTIYGIIGLVPLAVLWIYVTWMIVLFGLQLSFTTQYLHTLSTGELSDARQHSDCFIANDVTLMNILRVVTANFETNQGPVPAETLCSRLEMPAGFGSKILRFLVDEGLLVKTSEPTVGFVPGRTPETVTLADISMIVAKASFSQNADSAALSQLLNDKRLAQTQTNLKQLLADPSSELHEQEPE